MTLIMLILPKVFLLLIRYRRLLETLQTGSDEEMAQAVMSDANMLNSSMQSTDVDVDPHLYSTKRSAETFPVRKNVNNSHNGF